MKLYEKVCGGIMGTLSSDAIIGKEVRIDRCPAKTHYRTSYEACVCDYIGETVTVVGQLPNTRMGIRWFKVKEIDKKIRLESEFVTPIPESMCS